VFHGFLGERIKDWEACRELVKTIAAGYHLPYFTISPVFSVCPIHGYLEGEHFECPKCRKEQESAIEKEIAELESLKNELEESTK
jgi:ribonucleoside-triphosphate reductase